MSNMISQFADYLRARKINPVFVGIGLTLIVWGVGAGFVYLLVTRSSPPKPAPVVVTPPPPVETEVFRRAIDGVLVADATLVNPVVYGAMINNIVEARPAAGLSQAHLVFELPVEMGITRFLAIFADGDMVPKIGSVRSARDYAVDLMSEFAGPYVHVGGSPMALAELSIPGGIMNVDEFANAKTIFRVKNRVAPHNAYTSSDLMHTLIMGAKRDFGPVSPWLYQDEKKLEDRSGNAGVVVAYSTYQYEAEWKYDKAANDYIRYEGRIRQKDEDGKEVHAKNVAVMIAPATVIAGDEKGRLSMPVIGTGTAMILREGAVTRGTWKKASATDRLRFYNEEGSEVSFIPGTTWVEVVPDITKVKIKE